MEKKSANKNLRQAKTGKNDEFYTQLNDISNEMKYYKDHFKDKVVYCNCDDPRISKFFHYFAYNFKYLGLKKLISTCYKNTNPDLFSQNLEEKAVYIEYNGEFIENMPDYTQTHVKPLQSDGDFRSAECIELLKQVDIVVTNPPFSLFREYVAQLIEFDKKFIIVGHQNAITYKEVFKLIKEDKLWLGVDNGGTKWFAVQDHYDIATATRKKIENGQKYFSMGSVVWFTNLPHKKRNEEIILYKTYNPEEYPKYDNYDAIEVSKVADIPVDYQGVMGVPITFLDKFNPAQFEIIDGIGRYSMLAGPTPETQGTYLTMINGVPKYARIIIKHKKL